MDVVLPDQHGKTRAPAELRSAEKAGGGFPKAHAMRQEEIRYAVEQMKNSPWADSRNLFLMGRSEGGQATARNQLGDFRGIIISGWTCTHAKNPAFDGIHAPIETPVLAMAFDREATTCR